MKQCVIVKVARPCSHRGVWIKAERNAIERGLERISTTIYKDIYIYIYVYYELNHFQW